MHFLIPLFSFWFLRGVGIPVYYRFHYTVYYFHWYLQEFFLPREKSLETIKKTSFQSLENYIVLPWIKKKPFSLMQIELRASHLLGRRSTTWVAPRPVQLQAIFQVGSPSGSGTHSNLNAPTYQLPPSWDYRGTPPFLAYWDGGFP
jgi:hypothetical protein